MKRLLWFGLIFLLGCGEGSPYTRASIGKGGNGSEDDRPIGDKPSPPEEATATKKLQGQWFATTCKTNSEKICQDLVLAFSNRRFSAVTTSYQSKRSTSGDIMKMELRSGNIRFVSFNRNTKVYEVAFGIEKERNTNLIKFYGSSLEVNGMTYRLTHKVDENAKSSTTIECPILAGTWENETENRTTQQSFCDVWSWNNEKEKQFVIADGRWWKETEREIWTQANFTQNELVVQRKYSRTGPIMKERHLISTRPCGQKMTKKFYNFEIYNGNEKDPLECESFSPRI